MMDKVGHEWRLTQAYDTAIDAETRLIHAMAALGELRQRCADLQADLAAARADAERYRWLRECHPTRSDRTITVTEMIYKEGIFQFSATRSHAMLDAAIDAALSRERGK